MARSRVTVNGRTVAGWLNRDPAMQGVLRNNAVALMSASIANSPRGQSSSRALPQRGQSRRAAGRSMRGTSGYFVRHFRVRKYRYWYRLQNDDPFAHLVEWGSVNNPTYAPIRRAIRASRLRYIPNPDSRGG
jgi:hypothetical protein